MAKVLCVLYDDPADGHPVDYARDTIPSIQLYADGQTMPSPTTVDFRPGELLGNLSGAFGLREFLTKNGHTLVATSNLDGPSAAFDRALREADILIIQACWPIDLNAERIANAPHLKLVITAGTGSDQIDLLAAASRGLTVVEITQSDSVSAAEYAVMLVLSLVHDRDPPAAFGGAHPRPMAERVRRAYDLEGMQVGCVGAGRTGFGFLRRLRPFDVNLHYTDPRRLPLLVENELGLTYHPTTAALASVCDVVSIHCPLNNETTALFDTDMLGRMRRGAYLVNTSAETICDRDAVAEALRTGRLAGYATDAGYPAPASGRAPRVAGSTLSAQARYAAGTREVLECWFSGARIRSDYLIVDRGQPTTVGARIYRLGGPAQVGIRGTRTTRQ